MKKLALYAFLISLVILFNNQIFSQTVGIYTDNPNFKKDGVLFPNAANPNAGISLKGDCSIEKITDSTLIRYGMKKTGNILHVTFGGGDEDKIIFTADTSNPENGNTIDYSKFNKGRLIFWVKLIKQTDINIEVTAYRMSSSNVNGSDESLRLYHGLNIHDTTDWQRIVVDLFKPIDGDSFDYSQFMDFALRSRGNASDFLLGDMYVDVTETTTYGIFTDNPDNKIAGSFIGDPRIPNGGVWLNGQAFSEVVTDPNIVLDDTAWQVDFSGDGNDRVMWCVDLNNPQKASADFHEFNGGELIFHIKLITRGMDFSLEIIGFRLRSQNINGSDQLLSTLGLDTTDTEDWQTIRFDLTQGIGDDHDLFDYSQFCAFSLRDNNGLNPVGSFYVDEMYVRYPTTATKVNDKNKLPATFNLDQNYPNPFNPTTKISFNLKERNYTTLKVYNSLGQQVTELVNGELGAGSHQVTFDASKLSSGVYFYRLESGKYSQVKKMLLLK